MARYMPAHEHQNTCLYRVANRVSDRNLTCLDDEPIWRMPQLGFMCGDTDKSGDPPIMSERRVALLGGLLAGLGPLSLALFTPAMPVMAANYGTTDAAVKATLSVYFAGYAGAQLVSGPLSDRYGRRPMILIFLIVYLIGTCGALLATGIKIMLLSRAVQGIGAAAGLVMSRAIVRDVFTGDTSARVLNVSNIILGAGPAVAPAIGGAAMLVAGWRAPFVMMLLIGCVVILAASRWLIETRPSQTPTSGVFTTYLTLLRDPYFLWSALTIAGTVGTFYAQTAVMSFIVISRLGNTAPRKRA